MNEYYDIFTKHDSFLNNYDINQYYLENKFPKKTWETIMKKVISTVDFETIYGVELSQLLEAIGYAVKDGGLNFAIGAHTLASLIPFVKFASQEQKDKYLLKLSNGEFICCNAITETEAGSDIFSMKASAVKSARNFVLNGTKTFCSNIEEANIAIVYVLTDQNKGPHGGISAFLIEDSYFEKGQTFSKMGLRTCSIGELLLNNVSVSNEKLLGKEGAGLSVFTCAMNWERIGLSAIYVGTMQRLFEQCVDYAKNRIQGGKSIAKYQAISHKLAEMKTNINACRLMVLNAAKKLEKERSVIEDASMCKLFVSEHYIKLCQQAMQIHGGNGYMEEYEIERCLRDAHASTIYSGTSEIQKNIISKWIGL